MEKNMGRKQVDTIMYYSKENISEDKRIQFKRKCTEKKINSLLGIDFTIYI